MLSRADASLQAGLVELNLSVKIGSAERTTSASLADLCSEGHPQRDSRVLRPLQHYVTAPSTNRTSNSHDSTLRSRDKNSVRVNMGVWSSILEEVSSRVSSDGCSLEFIFPRFLAQIFCSPPVPILALAKSKHLESDKSPELLVSDTAEVNTK